MQRVQALLAQLGKINERSVGSGHLHRCVACSILRGWGLASRVCELASLAQALRLNPQSPIPTSSSPLRRYGFPRPSVRKARTPAGRSLCPSHQSGAVSRSCPSPSPPRGIVVAKQVAGYLSERPMHVNGRADNRAGLRILLFTVHATDSKEEIIHRLHRLGEAIPVCLGRMMIREKLLSLRHSFCEHLCHLWIISCFVFAALIVESPLRRCGFHRRSGRRVRTRIGRSAGRWRRSAAGGPSGPTASVKVSDCRREGSSIRRLHRPHT